MGLISRVADKTGALGSIVSAMGCGACFPALASFGAAIGLGFLQDYEGLFISRLMPLFAGLALLANALGWLKHRQWHHHEQTAGRRHTATHWVGSSTANGTAACWA